MYEVKKHYRTLSDGTEITTYKRNLTCLNMLEVEAGTTGLCGGDSGHGGRTYFRIEDIGGTDITVNPIPAHISNGGFEVILGGDSELNTIIEGLKFIVKVLEEGRSDELEY